MFDNIGGKIKTLVKILCWIGIVCSCISGIILMFTANFFIGLGVALLGSLLAWLSSFFIYGFGQLIENSDTLVQQNKELLNKRDSNNGKLMTQNSTPTNVAHKPDVIHSWRCNSCGKTISENPCPFCNNPQ